LPKVTVRSASFKKGAASIKGFPRWDLAEIAFAGRSNVGKSSALQVLLERKCKIRISRTPGRTREINFFEVTANDERLSMVDLPGFGYAKVPLWKRGEWGTLVDGYLENRANLKGLVLLCDLRRGPEDEERGLADWLTDLGIPFCLVLTKSDKLAKNKRKPAAYKASSDLQIPASRSIIFSAKNETGKQDLWAWIWRAIHRTT
jgi:GTP-binding protein